MSVSRAELEEGVLWACRLEVLARKPGNVHPGAAFSDLTCEDFLKSAELIAPVLGASAGNGVGEIVLRGMQATRSGVGTNTNLGILLLLAPLIATREQMLSRENVGKVLGALTLKDAEGVYEAIRLSQAGGMGEVAEQDVRQTPTVNLLEAMRMASGRDTIAAQYATNYELVFRALEQLPRSHERFAEGWEEETVRLALWLQAEVPDSLIARKCGLETAQEASRRAREVLRVWDVPPEREVSLREFDIWLRGDGNRRNPGTTADLVAAVLFVGFRDKILPLPEVGGAASQWRGLPEIPSC